MASLKGLLHPRKYVIVLGAVLALTAAVVVGISVKTPAAEASVPADASATTPCVASAAPAQWKHVVVLMFENHSYNGVIGSPDSPYITNLAHSCATTTSWYDADYKSPGVQDGSYNSKPNYATLTSGVSPSAHGLFDATGANCTTSFNGDYHDPLRYYNGDSGADAAYCTSNDQPLSNFWTNLNG